MANSSMFVLPISTASAALSFSTTVASYGGTKFSSILLPQVVRLALGAEHVLDRHRQAAQLAHRLAGGAAVVDFLGASQGRVRIDQ